MSKKELKKSSRKNRKSREFNDVKKEPDSKKKKSVGKIIFVIFLCLAIVIAPVCTFLYRHFSVSPTEVVEKPQIENRVGVFRQSSNSGVVVATDYSPRAEHIIHLLNEIGANKLHNTPFGETPKIKFTITDMNKDYYFSVVKKNVVEISEADPDIAIRAEKKIVEELYRSSNVKEKVSDYYNKGFIGVDIVASVKTLALKGYVSLYKLFV